MTWGQLRAVERLGAGGIGWIEQVGGIGRFFIDACAWLIRPPFRWEPFAEQFYFIANRSVFIVTLTALFSGMVFAIQFYFGFRMINADALVGPATALSVARELAPVFTAIVVTGRAGAAMAAELGSMRVTEQIDAIDVLAVNSVQYLVSPRILAGTLALPLLAIVFLFVANLGAYITGVYFLHIDQAVFYSHLEEFLVFEDLWQGLIKAVVFGVMFSTIGTFEGYFTTGGAEGVGRATNRAVVETLVLILIADYFLTLTIRYFLYPEPV